MSFGNTPTQKLWTMGNIQVQSVEQHKSLRFQINKASSFSHHQQSAGKSPSRVLNMVRRNFSSIFVYLQVVYGTYVRPITEYGSQIVYSELARDRDVLERIK